MLLTKKQLELLENALWERFSAGMSARPEMRVRNVRTDSGAMLIINITLELGQLERSNAQIQASNTNTLNMLCSVGANQYGSTDLTVSVSAQYAFITIFAHAHT